MLLKRYAQVGMQSAYDAIRRQPWLYDRRHDSMHASHRRWMHVMLRGMTRLAGLRHRFFNRSVPQGARLNLGSGRRPLPGWINADLNPFSGAEMWVDLRDRWPIRDNSVSAIYVRHCLEHFAERDLLQILCQCARVLQPGAGVRIGVPSLEVAIQQYLRRDFSFADWLTPHQPTAKTFVGYITDNGNHPIMLDFEYVAHLLGEAGFTQITRRPGGDSAILDASLLPACDTEADWATLYVEAVKPPREA